MTLFLHLNRLGLVAILAIAALTSNRGRAAESIGPAPELTNGASDTQLSPQMIEQIRRELDAALARNSEAITSASLTLLEPALARMQQRQTEALQSANRTVLIVAGIFAAVGFLAIVLITLILVRALGRFSEVAVANGPSRRELLAPASSPKALEAPADAQTTDGAVAQTSARFQGALEQLQRRIRELEHGLQSTSENRVLAMPAQGASSQGGTDAQTEPAVVISRTVVLLGKGQSLLNLGEAKDALKCFEQALELEPNNTDLLVKKGLALEQLENWDAALASYNRALALDPGLTVAYLYKGGVCNRLQRYQEALQSYERALHTERQAESS
jgi:tetratricopeptide (TPR) repeat protein